MLLAQGALMLEQLVSGLAAVLMISGRTVVVACFVTACTVGLAPAQQLETKDQVQGLNIICGAPRPTEAQSLCVGYIEGAADQLVGLVFCPPAGTAYLAMVQAFKNWTSRHPEQWSIPRGEGVAYALAETWPCPSN